MQVLAIKGRGGGEEPFNHALQWILAEIIHSTYQDCRFEWDATACDAMPSSLSIMNGVTTTTMMQAKYFTLFLSISVVKRACRLFDSVDAYMYYKGSRNENEDDTCNQGLRDSMGRFQNCLLLYKRTYVVHPSAYYVPRTTYQTLWDKHHKTETNFISKCLRTIVLLFETRNDHDYDYI
jgi:hypothetical protein